MCSTRAARYHIAAAADTGDCLLLSRDRHPSRGRGRRTGPGQDRRGGLPALRAQNRPATRPDDRRLPRRGQGWAAAADGKVAGFIILIPRPGYLLLENVAVLPAAQGQGIGARLLALAEDRARIVPWMSMMAGTLAT